jgi:hypothetical protein
MASKKDALHLRAMDRMRGEKPVLLLWAAMKTKVNKPVGEKNELEVWFKGSDSISKGEFARMVYSLNLGSGKLTQNQTASLVTNLMGAEKKLSLHRAEKFARLIDKEDVQYFCSDSMVNAAAAKKAKMFM